MKAYNNTEGKDKSDYKKFLNHPKIMQEKPIKT